MELYPLAVKLASCPTSDDKFNHLVSEGAIDVLYAHIACGVSMEDIASSLGLSNTKMEMMLQRTPDASNKYLSAKLSALSLLSINTMVDFADVDSFTPAQASAMTHHRQVVAMGHSAMEKLSASLKPKHDNAPTIIVNNVNQIGGGTVPPIPSELTGVVIENGT